jgi:predicted nucleic acid-binding protein
MIVEKNLQKDYELAVPAELLKIGLDTNFFMAIFLQEEGKLDASARVLWMIADGVLTAIVSTITLVEIATLFCQKQELERAKKAIEVVVSMQNTIFVDITTEIALPVANIKVLQHQNHDAGEIPGITE